jgi:two-component system, OmpR family, sensor kinase
MHRTSIRTRIALIVFAASAVVLTLTSVIVYEVFEKSLTDGFNQDLEDRSASYSSLVDVSSGTASMRLMVDPRRDRAQGEALVRLFAVGGGVIEDGSPSAGSSVDEAALIRQSASSSASVVSTLSYSDGEDFRVLAVPIYDSNKPVAVLITGLETATVDSPLSALRIILLLATPVASLGLALIAFTTVRRGLLPVTTITESARRIASGDLQERITGVHSNDEVGELANTFNEMIDRLAETVEHERRFTADAAHELRTPLAGIETAIEVTLSAPRSSSEYETALSTVQAQTTRLNRLMRQLLLLSKLDVASFQSRLEMLDLGQLLEGVTQSFAEEHPETSVRYDGLTTPIECRGDEELLTRAFSNVLENSVLHASQRVNIRVSLAQIGERGIIVIADDGPGISEDLASTVFHRFRRGDSARSEGGSGLGLSIVEAIVRVHHGSVKLLPTSEGAAFQFSLPVITQENPSGQPQIQGYGVALP